MKKIKWGNIITVLSLLSYAWIIPYEIRAQRFDGVALIPLIVLMIIWLVPMAITMVTFDIDSMDIPDLPDGKWR